MHSTLKTAASWRFFWDYQSNIYLQQGLTGEPETIGFIVLAVILALAATITVVRGRNKKFPPEKDRRHEENPLNLVPLPKT